MIDMEKALRRAREETSRWESIADERGTRMDEIQARAEEAEAKRDKLENMLEYCWHHRECSAIDADGEWRIGNPPCDCGYDEALATLEVSEGDDG